MAFNINIKKKYSFQKEEVKNYSSFHTVTEDKVENEISVTYKDVFNSVKLI